MAQVSFVPFSESVMAGAVVVNIFAILCTLAILSVALRVAWLAIRSYKVQDGEKPQEYVFFRTQLGNYAACLLVAVTFNTAAGIMALPWLVGKGISLGPACTAQAVLMQIGTWSSGFFTVSIAFHTFNALVLKRRRLLFISRCMMCFGWAVSGVMAALPFLLPTRNGEPVYGVDGLMCGIQGTYPQFRFLLHLLPILIASVFSAILYSSIFLVLRGTLKIQGGVRLTLDPSERWNNTEDDKYHRFIARVARSMIWYPVAYVALLLPYSILRLLEISGFVVPFQALVFACACWFMLGVVDVALLYNTVRILGPAFDARSQASTRKDLESFRPSTMIDKHYSTNFSRGQRVTQEKVQYLHTPMPSYSSNESVGSESGLLASQSRRDDKQSPFGYSNQYTGYSTVTSPKRSMGKVEALAHSPQSSVSDTSYQQRHVRMPSFSPSPLSVDGRIERHQPSSSLDSTSGLNASPTFRPLRRSVSFSSPDGPSQTRYALPSRLPPRQLTLLASRTAPPTFARTSPARSPEASPRPLLLPSQSRRGSMFANPRSPPTPPTAISRLR